MESRKNRIYALEMLRFKGQAEYELGFYDDARETLILARDYAQEFGSKRNLWPVLHYLSKVQQAQGGPESDQFIDEARKIGQQISDTIERPDIRDAYLSLRQVREVLQSK